jgi:hypothetical protein
MVDHRRRLNDRRIGRASALTAAALGAHDTRFLLRLADVQHALALFERLQVLLRDFVLGWFFSKLLRGSKNAQQGAMSRIYRQIRLLTIGLLMERWHAAMT